MSLRKRNAAPVRCKGWFADAYFPQNLRSHLPRNARSLASPPSLYVLFSHLPWYNRTNSKPSSVRSRLRSSVESLTTSSSSAIVRVVIPCCWMKSTNEKNRRKMTSRVTGSKPALRCRASMSSSHTTLVTRKSSEGCSCFFTVNPRGTKSANDKQSILHAPRAWACREDKPAEHAGWIPVGLNLRLLRRLLGLSIRPRPLTTPLWSGVPHHRKALFPPRCVASTEA